MPFIEANEVKELINEGLKSVIDTPGLFEFLETTAAEMITDVTGLVAPGDAADAPKWVKVPAAYIIEKLAAPRLSSSSEEAHARIDERYKTALDILERHRKQGVATPSAPVKSSYYAPLNKVWR